ncbi:hypothetical protein [Flammeovirga kamogawensis]|uniref:META domain-containing protein n=1 Tax=Flammeovirga kamogawensis TaxID=373891 RepID=A0ABX8H3N5_9BACT|nr:hypothetical protein [Flammeovirga kamogawensis]MBB6461873.1 hypothetical protein [Flammeovirga kamogawensis]QWG10513.1 hypothetical protein KM029_26430 [Flammeovirga kamogawensis]TRX63622.1 hypothetical protein EO216_24705 [Flammeovirga kamogawensis]
MKKLLIYISAMLCITSCLNPEYPSHINTNFENELEGEWANAKITLPSEEVTDFSTIQTISFTGSDNRVTMNILLEDGRDTVQYGVWKYSTVEQQAMDSTNMRVYTCNEPYSYTEYVKLLAESGEDLEDIVFVPFNLDNNNLSFTLTDTTSQLVIGTVNMTKK